MWAGRRRVCVWFACVLGSVMKHLTHCHNRSLCGPGDVCVCLCLSVYLSVRGQWRRYKTTVLTEAGWRPADWIELIYSLACQCCCTHTPHSLTYRHYCVCVYITASGGSTTFMVNHPCNSSSNQTKLVMLYPRH